MKVAKLVYTSFVNRVIVEDTDTNEQIEAKAAKQLIDMIQKDGIGEHVEETILDLEVPINENDMIKDPYKLDKYWHVLKTENSISVDCFETHECSQVENSIASFTERKFAIDHSNSKHLE